MTSSSISNLFTLTEEDIISLKETGLDFFSLACSCLSHFNLVNCNDIRVLQLAIFVRIYYSYAPEECDWLDGSTAKEFTSTIIQLSYSLGFHRDPSRLPKCFRDINMDNLCRKIWYYVLYLDYKTCLYLGDPLVTQYISFDTRLPFYDNPTTVLTNRSVEQEIFNEMCKQQESFNLLGEILECVSRQDEVVELNFISEKILSIESLLQSYSYLNSKLEGRGILSFSDIRELEQLITFKIFLWPLYYRLLIHFEEKGDKKMVCLYVKKAIENSIVTPFHLYLLILTDKSDAFTKHSDLVVIPNLLAMMHRTASFSISILMRVKCLKFIRKSNQDSNFAIDGERDMVYMKTDNIEAQLRNCLNCQLHLLEGLCNRYYGAWRLIKVFQPINQVVFSDEFYTEHIVCTLSCSTTLYENSLDVILDTLNPLLKRIDEERATWEVYGNKELENQNNLLNQSGDPNRFDNFQYDFFSNRENDINEEVYDNMFDLMVNPGIMFDKNIFLDHAYENKTI